jgi:SAM-dependent methyltransferase
LPHFDEWGRECSILLQCREPQMSEYATTSPLGGRIAEEIVCVQKPETVDDVDEAGYLDANPDIRKAGMQAREHFFRIGQREGRLQFVNQERVAEMREKKLRSLRFRRQSSAPRNYGEPTNFLSPETVAEFGIPESPPVSANQYGGPFLDEIRGNPERLCLDVGAGLRYSYLSNVVNTEIYPSISTDVLCVGEDLPFDSDQFDYVICASVLEHARRPWEVASEICRVLKPGGKLLVDYPYLQTVHGYPHHYFNATPQGAISLFERYCDTLSSTIEPNNHPIQSIWWILTIWRHGLEGIDRDSFENLTIGQILATPPEAHLEASFCGNLTEEARRIIPAGSTMIARKKSGYAFETSAAPNDVLGGGDGGSRQDAAMHLRELVGALEAEVAALRASRSWRLTAPLRALHRRWRQFQVSG